MLGNLLIHAVRAVRDLTELTHDQPGRPPGLQARRVLEMVCEKIRADCPKYAEDTGAHGPIILLAKDACELLADSARYCKDALVRLQLLAILRPLSKAVALCYPAVK